MPNLCDGNTDEGGTPVKSCFPEINKFLFLRLRGREQQLGFIKKIQNLLYVYESPNVKVTDKNKSTLSLITGYTIA